jgi:PhoH-like ATPase
MKTILIDTNLYLDDSNIIFKLANSGNKILLPLMVLKELDKHKFNKDLSYSARNAIKSISEFTSYSPDRVIFDSVVYEGTPDEKILKSALTHDAIIATKDVSMSIQAKSMGIETFLYETVLNNIFNPYIHVHMNDVYKVTEEDIFSFQDFYEGEEYCKLLKSFSNFSDRQIEKDCWIFILINVDKEEPIVYANNPMKKRLERIDDKSKYREIVTNDFKLKARDCYQVCAIYSLENAPHTLITGRWGSGKTLISTAHTLARSKKKAFITRAPIGINSKYDIGFLPGDRAEKMLDWLQGFMSALYYLYANTRSDSDGNGKTYDHVKDSIFPQKFEIVPMNSIQGLSLLDNDTMIVDEAQLITIDYLSMILSRPSETGRLILLGDIKQTYDVVKPSESGLLKLLRNLPHKYLSYVELQNSYRSPLLELADKLQDRSI